MTKFRSVYAKTRDEGALQVVRGLPEERTGRSKKVGIAIGFDPYVSATADFAQITRDL